jgi:hypothetical protein
MHDVIEKAILKVFSEAEEVLETKEVLEGVQSLLEGVTRTKIFYRLNLLRGERLICGKFVGPGKGVWIWWDNNIYLNHEVKNGK